MSEVVAALAFDPRCALRIWRRDWRVFAKLWKGVLMGNFLDPLFYLFAMGFGLGSYVASVNGVSYRDFIAPGLVASAAMYAVTFESTYNVYIKMEHHRIYEAMISTPVEVPDLVVGELAWSATRGFLYGGSFLAVVAALGLIGSPWALLILPLLFLGTACFAVIGMGFTALIPKIDFYSYFFTLFITPMFLFSGLFFPLTRLPEALQVAAWFTPLYHLVAAFRDLSVGEHLGAAAGHVLWLLVVTALLLPLPILRMRRRLVA